MRTGPQAVRKIRKTLVYVVRDAVTQEVQRIGTYFTSQIACVPRTTELKVGHVHALHSRADLVLALQSGQVELLQQLGDFLEFVFFIQYH